MPADRDAQFRILCLEPNRDLRELYALLLSRLDVSLVGAADPFTPTCAEVAGASGVLLDPFPISADFWRVLLALRADPAARHLPILAISADVRRLSTHARELASLNCDVLPKPFDLDAFDGWVQSTFRIGEPNAA